MTEKWSKPLSLSFNPLVSFTVTVILASVAVCQFGDERIYIEGLRGGGGGKGSLNTATLNEVQDADAREENVSPQEAPSGSRWRRFESGAPFLHRHQP